jgi:hypothetical protein
MGFILELDGVDPRAAQSPLDSHVRPISEPSPSVTRDTYAGRLFERKSLYEPAPGKSVERPSNHLKPNGWCAEAINTPRLQTLGISMSNSFNQSLPSDMSLLLRADAEQCWLSHEVIPVLRHLEAREQLPEEEVGAALAYLEATWNEAMLRARETDAAHADLRSRDGEFEELSGPAGRYHAAVRVLRGIVAERVTPLVDQPVVVGRDSPEIGATSLHLTDTHLPPADGRRPRAA